MESTAGLIGQTLGQFRITEQIGEGGMATVFKAYQPGLNRAVALKVLPPHFAKQADFTERFSREAQAIGNLHHPNILPVYDSGQDKGYSYLAMRYIPNARTLTDEMKQPLKTERIIEVINQIAGALDHAHKAGIIHRDVKPSNILLDGEWALLSDFGLAKMVESSSDLTGTGVGMGTPAYMSPEQGMGKKVDHRTDIYALGIILYEMLTGQVPHRAETPIATVFKRINEPLPLPRSLNPNIPEAVERVLLKTLAPDPTQRFDSAGEMAATLKAAFGPRPENVLTDLDQTRITPAGRTATPVVQPTGNAVATPAPGQPAKSESPMTLVGFAGIGLLLLLILGGIGVLIFREVSPPPTVSAGATATPADQVALVTNIPMPTNTAVPTNTPVATNTPVPTNTPVETETPTNTPLPPTAAPTEVPKPTVAPLPAAMTGAEINQLALAEAVKWQPDAVLSEIGTLAMGPLDAEGKSTSWQLKYWSPTSKGINTLMFMNGQLTSTTNDLPTPKAIVVGDKAVLDTKRLYEAADAAGAAEYTAQGYRPIAAITPSPLDETRLTWYFNYAGGDYRVVYTVIIDAMTGEVMQAIKME